MHYWEHVDTLLPNLYGARVNYLLEQAFWTRTADPMNPQHRQTVESQFDTYWNEWVTFRDDMGAEDCGDNPMLSNGLAYAGLGYLYVNQYSRASAANSELAYLDAALRYYLMGYRHNQGINDRIVERLRELPGGACGHLNRMADTCPDLQDAIRDIRGALNCQNVQQVVAAEPLHN